MKRLLIVIDSCVKHKNDIIKIRKNYNLTIKDMETNINNTREKYTLEKNPKTSELELVIMDTKKEIEILEKEDYDNPPIQLETELAKISGLNKEQISKIEAEHKQKRPLTIANVMKDFEVYMNMKNNGVLLDV
ncbi:MAG: hypothetical protein LBU14_02315 [Candidatus Peribacteria bacterium]|jgi:hypothetical protein|nr:hypothetical protein [Candidatus Peribacteria bacterium]